MLNANLDILHGVWSVGNADQGQYLATVDDRIVTGGEVLIDSRFPHFFARLEMRTGGNAQTVFRLAGPIRKVADERFMVLFTDGTRAELTRLPDGRLLCTSHTGQTVEHELVLSPARQSIAKDDRTRTRLPPILLNTMPKSGSIFILRCLSQGLGIGETKIATNLFPDDLIIREKLDDLALGNLIAQQHLPARDINLSFLGRRLDRMIVHVRNPRQAMLSWLHHLDNFHAHRHIEPACELGLEAVTPALPPDYFERTISEKIDHLLDAHLPQLINWTEDWVDAADSRSGLEIRITTFENFVADPAAFLESLLDYFGIAQADFDATKLPRREARTHFRKGLTDEWRTVFSAAQQDKAAAMIPETLARRFAW
jgi:hypothetical protein